MNAPFSQDSRMGRLTTALGKDALVLLRFDGSDYVNGLFQYRVEALSSSADLDFDGLIGTHASVEIETQNDGTRVFDGIVTEATWAGVGENGNKYALTLRPWFWIAGRRRNQRIFHNKTVIQIIEDLFKPYSGLGDPAFEIKVTGSYPELEYTVQYRESDLDFATRLMERFGISYHFAHSVGGHTLVLTDAVDQHQPIAGGEREYKPIDGAQQSGKEHFWEWHPERRMTTGAVRLTDYNFKTPSAAMEVDRVGDASYAEGQIESYDYPGDYLDQGAGKDVVGLRMLQERGQDARHRALGDCTSLGAGMTLTLTGDQVHGLKGADYLCLAASHSYVSDSYGSGGAESDGRAYSGEYTLMPVTAPLAPARKTRMPVVQGPQTAVVVGEGEIDCDEYGRILVHFHWDLNKAYSMRCRVSQNWASKGWGGMVIPRIGMEVVVEFLEGDPDKPLVTGCVYNGKNDPPYELPKHKTRSTFKTDTHNGSGFNELRFEDERDEEEVYVHAQKDMNTVVLNNKTERIENNHVSLVEHNKESEVTRNHNEVVGGNMSIHVGPTAIGNLINRMAVKVGNKLGEVAKAIGLPPALDPGAGNYALTVEKNKMEAVGLTSVRTVGLTDTNFIGSKHKLAAGTEVQISAGDRIVLSCGKSVIEMKKDGTIAINGVEINEKADKLIKLSADKIDIN